MSRIIEPLKVVDERQNYGIIGNVLNHKILRHEGRLG